MTARLIAFALCCLFSSQVFGQFRASSVLASPGFHKISVEEAGMYKIDAEFLSNLVEGPIRPSRIALYGNKGGILPEASADDRIDDLEQIPMMLIGNGDDVMTGDEYFVVYVEGDEHWRLDAETPFMQMNPYDQLKYYYINVNETSPLRIENAVGGITPVENVDSYDDFQQFEVDVLNLQGTAFGRQGTGRRWYGADFGLERQVRLADQFDLSQIVEGSPMHLDVTFAVRSDKSSQARVELGSGTDGRSMGSLNLFSSLVTYARRASLSVSEPYSSAADYTNMGLYAVPSSNNYSAWLDYATLHTQKRLIVDNQPLFFQVRRTDDRGITFNVSAEEDVVVWHIPAAHTASAMSDLQNGPGLRFVGSANERYVAFAPRMVSNAPAYIEEVLPQNLHAMETPEYVILYPSEFESEALRLAEHRSTHDGLNTVAIDVTQVYNEFGGGSPDPTAIRDFARMLYLRSDGFRYLCLFGDATYDYRGLNPQLKYDNFIPCFQTNFELNPITGFPTDDYYALLDANEGGNLEGGVDIAVGRMPVGSVLEARIAVDKIIDYDTNVENNGSWKNDMILVADDQDGNTHLEQNERLVNRINGLYPQTNMDKVYFDAFEQRSTTGDDRYPDAENALRSALDQGALMVNYFGHGGPNGWAQERVFDIQDIVSLNNPRRLPLFITATCTFTGYDDAGEKSGGELTYLNASGGSIALVSTVRAVTIFANERLVNSFLEFVYDREEDGGPMRLGEVMRNAKNNHRSDTLSINARKFALIGDPALQLAFPDYTVELAEINSISADIFADTIGALSELRLRGHILDRDENVKSDFNGLIDVTLFDKPQEIMTRANDDDSDAVPFDQLTTTLFTGSTTVQNGEFEISFRIPQDIDYEFGAGRLSFYAQNTTTGEDANGYQNGLIIGGTDENGLVDDTPPVVQLFMDNRSFVSGDRTSPNPTLIADLEDDFGINLSNAAIGHQITAILDGDVSNPILLNSFYEAVPGEIAKGVINFPFNNLSPGLHSLTVQAYDIVNNRTEASIEFIVDEAISSTLTNTRIYPNPASSFHPITLEFNHALPAGAYNLNVEVYDMMGRRMAAIDDVVNTGRNGSIAYTFSGIGQGNQTLSTGLYLYSVQISSTSDASANSALFEGGRFLIVD